MYVSLVIFPIYVVPSCNRGRTNSKPMQLKDKLIPISDERQNQPKMALATAGFLTASAVGSDTSPFMKSCWNLLKGFVLVLNVGTFKRWGCWPRLPG